MADSPARTEAAHPAAPGKGARGRTVSGGQGVRVGPAIPGLAGLLAAVGSGAWLAAFRQTARSLLRLAFAGGAEAPGSYARGLAGVPGASCCPWSGAGPRWWPPRWRSGWLPRASASASRTWRPIRRGSIRSRVCGTCPARTCPPCCRPRSCCRCSCGRCTPSRATSWTHFWPCRSAAWKAAARCWAPRSWSCSGRPRACSWLLGRWICSGSCAATERTCA